MLDQVCCIIDVDGFSVQRTNPYNETYRNDFLVRELGYVRVDPTYSYLPRSYRFDLSRAFDFSQCTPEMERTLSYQSCMITGLSLFPGSQETDSLDLKLLPQVITKVYDRCKRMDATVVAFKGGHREADLLDKTIPCVDLQKFGCPSFEKLLEMTSINYKDCGFHREVPGRKRAHCPLAEVAAYRDWFMYNVGKYKRRNSKTCAGSSSDCCCGDCYSSSD